MFSPFVVFTQYTVAGPAAVFAVLLVDHVFSK